MTAKTAIPVRITERTPPINAGVAAVLHELADKLARFVDTGEAGAVELQSLPMTGADRAALESFLGPGEVTAELDVMGPTRVRETGCHGVWWIEHRNPEGRLIAETLEVTRVPEILVTPEADMSGSLNELRDRLNNWLETAGEDDERE